MDPISAIFGIGSKIIDRFWPDAEEAGKRKAELMVMAQQGELKELEIAMSAIIAEANSDDPWTSRARPTFLYVVYIIILTAIPMGVLHAFSPDIASNIADGFKNWLGAIPDAMWSLFGAGYLGYSASRTYDKHSKNKNK